MPTGFPITELQRRRIIEMRADGHTIKATAADLGLSWTSVWLIAPGYVGKVPNDRLRAAFLESGVSPTDVARHLGWECKHGAGRGRVADGSRVCRTLGLMDDISGSNGCHSRRKSIDWETGSLIAEAIGVAAWSVLDSDDELAA